MSNEILAEIENTPSDPFWTGHSSVPFRSDFSGDGFEYDDGVTVSRCGTEILVEVGERTIYLDLAEAMTTWGALKAAINELRKVHQEQQRYLSERTSEGFAKKFAALPEDIMKASKEAAGITKILAKVSEDPVKESFWVCNAIVLLDQLRESLHVIHLTVSAAKAQAQVVSKKEKGDDVA